MIGILMSAVTLIGCSNPDCTKQLVSVANNQGTRTAVLEVSVCGGATVGYTTDLKIVRMPKPVFGAVDYAWTVKGWVDADLRWVTPTQLEVRYPASLQSDDVVHKAPQSFDVNIVYIPQGK